MNARHALNLTFTAAVVLFAPALMAESLFPYNSLSSALINNDLNNVHGAIEINEAAGASNQQANLGALSFGSTAFSHTSWQASTDPLSALYPDNSEVWISNAFQNSAGWLAINQAAGSSNQQGNAMDLSSGLTAITANDTLLAMTSPNQASSVANGFSTRTSHLGINDTAFEGAHGVIQINQAGGTGNSSFNHFSLTVSDEAK
ncbi:MAG: hypothetical protein KGI54_12140 [Pseudomonadota bacterium]|nr:hypothetical protein [Pseudomonadota bacterium]